VVAALRQRPHRTCPVHRVDLAAIEALEGGLVHAGRRRCPTSGGSHASYTRQRRQPFPPRRDHRHGLDCPPCVISNACIAADQYAGRRSARHSVGSRGVAECACVALRGRFSQGSHRHGVAAGRQPSTALSPISRAPLVSRRLGYARWPRGARGTSWPGTCSRAPRGIGHRHRGAVGSAHARSSYGHVRHANLADRSVDGVSGQRCARRTRCHRLVHGRRTRRFVLGS
jgi:hypothetical protein